MWIYMTLPDRVTVKAVSQNAVSVQCDMTKDQLDHLIGMLQVYKMVEEGHTPAEALKTIFGDK